MLKIARPDSLQNFMDTAKTTHFDLFVYTNNHFKETQNKKTCQQLTERTE